jgi:glycine/D-amino acid oxidase-like deaminating enzyme
VIDQVPGLDNAWVGAGHDGDGLLMAPATGQALTTWIATSRQPREVASFGLSRFDGPHQDTGRGGGPVA